MTGNHTFECVIFLEKHMKIIDISQELFSCRVFPGNPRPSFERVETLGHDPCNLTHIATSVHNGTHVDAPRHFIDGGKAVDELDLSLFYGACTVARCSGVIGEREVAPILQNCRERLLLKGDCELCDSGAAAVANSHVKLLGVENQSVGGSVSPMSVHVILLRREIVILEGLDLSRAEEKDYVLSAFPLNLAGSDGAPVRAVLLDAQS